MTCHPSNTTRGPADNSRPTERSALPETDSDDLATQRGGETRLAALVTTELKAHAPFTMLGALTGMCIVVALSLFDVPRTMSVRLFWTLHPIHVLLSALVTTALFILNSRHALLKTIVVGYLGSVGIATLSDCIIPYLAECLLGLPNRGFHLGFIEKWWLVNPLAGLGILLAHFWPHTELPHAGHVLLSTWASLFHITMAMGAGFGIFEYVTVIAFLFLAVWIPCCTSDIVFPLLFTKKSSNGTS